MTQGENERLARVETKVDNLSSSVDELKADVKTLLIAHYADKGVQKGRRDTGVWVRAALPWAIGLGSALVTLFGILTR